MSAAQDLAEVVRIEGARVLATLVRTTGNFSVAEEAVQEAALAALRSWPVDGTPESPRAWLTAAARRRAIDLFRREALRRSKEQAGTHLMDQLRLDDAEDPVPSSLPDDLLRLIFTCCHPSLAPDARLALALRTLCQLSVAEVAAVLLTTEAAMAKRLVRTRQKIALAKIPYRVPGDAELPERLAAVCGVVHALYTAGHAPLGGDQLIRLDLCTEGLRLARLLRTLLPDEPLPAAVLALILLTEARRPARLDDAGEVVLLRDQDRARWDAAFITEGVTLLEESLRRTAGIADPYQLQAAIAAEHDRASSYLATDWAAVVRLYDLLLSVAPSPPAALARAVAVSEWRGAEAGLEALAEVPAGSRREAIRADLLASLGRFAEAVDASDRSLSAEMTAPERAHRQRSRERWSAAAQAPQAPRAAH